jgi:hypothetical protein
MQRQARASEVETVMSQETARDMATIVCEWGHAIFLWTQVLTRRRLFYDRAVGDLAALRDALLAARAAGSLESISDAIGDHDGRHAPLILRLPRTVATEIAWQLAWARALPPEAPTYDAESPLLYHPNDVVRAQEIGIEWQRQLYRDPIAP